MMKTHNRYVPRGVNGILLLNKSMGISSNHALQQIKHLYQAQKAGHTGSLDPLATGMLPICFGEATKFSHFLLDADKAYQTTAKLGLATATGDAEGEIILQQTVPLLSEKLIFSVLQQFQGNIEQLPPMYSALKHQGRPLYELARKGIEVERKKRCVKIFEIKLVEFSRDTLSLQVHCSKGTYIRTLVEDIARALGTVAHVTHLHRRWVAPFQTFPMHSFEEAVSNEFPMDLLLPVDAALKMYPAITLKEDEVMAIQNGKQLELSQPSDAEFFRLIDLREKFLGMGMINAQGKLAVKRLISTGAV